jgi:transcriptional regulator with XRE-family HTH domain
MATTTPSSQATVGQRIRAARLRKGWNQLELASKSGVSRTTLYQMERGLIPTPRAATLHRLAKTLDIPVAWLDAEESLEPFPVAHDNPPAAGGARTFDRLTNPFVDVVARQSPELFAGFTAEDWDELYSTFGVGGALTEEGVFQTAARIARKRETLRRVSILLETHLAEPTAALVNSLFQLIEVPTADAASAPPLDA